MLQATFVELDLLQIFFIGVASTYGACLVTCWPVALPFVTAENKGVKGNLKAALVFLSAKCVAYCLMGLAAGGLGRFFTGFLHAQGRIVFVLAGVLVVMLAVKSTFTSSHSCPGKLRSRLKEGSLLSLALLGFVIGVIPCATTLAVMAYIAFSADGPLAGALLGLAFGAGKFFSPLIPISMMTGGLFHRLKSRLNLKILRYICAGIVAVLGIRLIILGIQAFGYSGI